MLFWIVAALLTLAASLAVLLPLTGGRRGTAPDQAHDLEVYRDQLAELDRDAGRGLIDAAEAEEARAEIARRMIRADRDGRAPARAAAAPKALAAAAVLAVPLVSWGIYAALGSPDLPSQPLQERLARSPADSSVDELVARAEAHLAANLADGRGWDVLAPIYLRLSRFAESENAYRNAIRLLGASADREAGLGEAIAAVAGGLINTSAQQAFERALALEPAHPKAQFFLASALAQEGKAQEAIEAWEKLAAAQPDSPWREAAGRAIEATKARLAEADAPGPSADDMAAAEQMSPDDRAAMIEQMVTQLDERLRQNPRDLEGWSRLVRSYQVLGRADAARDALMRGTAALGASSPEAGRLIALAQGLGIAVTE